MIPNESSPHPSPEVTPSRTYVGLVQVSASGVLWGTGGLAVVLVNRYADLSALTITAYRAAIATVLVVAAVVALRRTASIRVILSRHLVRAIIVGVLMGLMQWLFFVAVIAVGVTVATVVTLGIAPVLMTGVTAARTRAAPPLREVTIVLAALVGLVLVAGSSGSGVTGPQPVLGVIAALASGAAFAAATDLGTPLARGADPLAVTAVTTTIAALGLIPVALLTVAVIGGPIVTTDLTALLVLLYMGAVTMALAYGLLYAGLRTTSSSTAVIAILLEPVTAAVVATLFLGEVLRPAGIVGGVFILLALAGSGRAQRSPLETPTNPTFVSAGTGE